KNGPIHSCNRWENFLSGSLETAKSGKLQPASEASVVTGPNNNKNNRNNNNNNKTCHVCTGIYKHAHRTKPSGQGFKESFWAAHSRVKLWYTNLDSSVASTEAKANVCCVKFSPSFRYHLAFGCADHCVHYYDFPNTEQPIMVFKGHQKAVFYAKFVSGEEMVFASTDRQLKLWNVGKSYSPCSFKGHINEKNFVDLASNGDYKACGSENNSLYLYYKGLSNTLLTFKFDAVKSVLDKD
ncbi:hypothetical protein H8959_012350, partial [Pygathrix nigripes]